MARAPALDSLSLRRRLALLFAAVALVVVAASVLGVLAFTSLVRARGDLIDRLDPAVEQRALLLGALVNQETAVRGYALSGQDRYLAPYRRGRTEEAAAARTLRTETATFPSAVAALAVVTRRAQAWRAAAVEPTLRSVRAGRPAPVAQLDRAQARFDAVRRAAAGLRRVLDVEQHRGRRRLDASSNRLLVLAVVLAVVAIGTALALFDALRRWVTRPLGHLGREADRVAAGDFVRPIAVVGPPEIAGLGATMETMRERIVGDLRQTERLNADLARSNAELEQFAYVASHDLQEPLRKVAGFTGMLKRRYAGQLDERADQYIEFASDGALRMQTLINDLLAFSRVGRTTERFAPVALDAALADALRDLSGRVEDAGARVEAAPLPTVSGDRSLLSTLLLNLVGNALKFRRPGVAPHVVIRCERSADDYAITVADNGIGIEPEYAERVFVIFQRLHAKERYAGTGIGLALCRKIVEYHGGAIAVVGDAGPGTAIRFTLPVPAAPTA